MNLNLDSLDYEAIFKDRDIQFHNEGCISKRGTNTNNM